jgi:hypothetical protein
MAAGLIGGILLDGASTVIPDLLLGCLCAFWCCHRVFLALLFSKEIFASGFLGLSVRIFSPVSSLFYLYLPFWVVWFGTLLRYRSSDTAYFCAFVPACYSPCAGNMPAFQAVSLGLCFIDEVILYE